MTVDQRRSWMIEVEGFDPYVERAWTRSQARYRAYLKFVEGWTHLPFRRFLDICRVTVL